MQVFRYRNFHIEKHVFIVNNLLISEQDRIKAFNLIFTSGLTELRLPQIMIFRGEDRRLKPIDAILHESSELLNALDHEERLRLTKVKLNYYNSNRASQIDSILSSKKAKKKHKKNVKKLVEIQKRKD